jgi:arylformamidase
VAPIYRSFDQDTLNREYSPSSCVDDLTVYIDEYLQLSQAVKQRAELTDQVFLDLSYGPRPAQRLDLFLADAQAAPVNLYIHGGYWQELSKDYSCFAAPLFADQKYAFAALGYSLAPQHPLSDIVEECRCAVEWLYLNAERLNLDKHRIHISGSSAGAQLAMMLYTTDWEKRGLPSDIIKSACAVSGVYDLEPVRLSYVNEVLAMDPEEALENSPMFRTPSALTPVTLAYGSNETSEFKRQSDEYRSKLEALGVPVTYREINNRNHFDVILDLADASSWLASATLNHMDNR